MCIERSVRLKVAACFLSAHRLLEVPLDSYPALALTDPFSCFLGQERLCLTNSFIDLNFVRLLHKTEENRDGN